MIETNKFYNADCLDILKDLPDKSVDLVLTDYPYAVDENYSDYSDTTENLKELIINSEKEIIRISKFALITCGTHNIKNFKYYDDIFDIQQPANPLFCNYGHITWQPLLVYGKDPHTLLKNKWMSIKNTEIAEKSFHPCPKPTLLWQKILLRGSANDNDLILDPFSGSGTTAIACHNLNRRFICIEKDKEYFDKSVLRYQNHIKQLKLL
jgi:site-specific DNA-methyltransferase (adenine-specific)